jgi:rod shape-determining protein MreB and related proteins
MKGRVKETTTIYSPIKAPKFTDEDLLQAMLKMFLAKVSSQVYFFSPTILVSLSGSFYPSMTGVLSKVLTNLGAGEVLIIDQSLAAVIGSGVPVADTSGSFILQMGYGVVEASCLSLGKVVESVYDFKAGLSLEQELMDWFVREQQLKISQTIAQQVIDEAASFDRDSKRSVEVVGQDVKSGGLQKKRVLNIDLYPLLINYADSYQQLVKKLLASVSPDLTVDILDKGLLLSGGLAQVHGLENFLSSSLKMPVFIVDDPQQAAIKGVGMVMDHLDEFKQSLSYTNSEI